MSKRFFTSIFLGAAVAAPLVSAASAAVAPLAVAVQSQTRTTVTLAWTPPAGAEGYAFKVNGRLISTSQNGATATVRFSASNCTSPNACTVRAFSGLAEGSVSIGATPQPPSAAVVVTQAGGAACPPYPSSLSAAQFNATIFPADTTVGVCGTITSTLTPRGAGSDGHPVTIQFQPGASISQPYCNPCMSIIAQSYLIVDGNHVGAVQSNANGTIFANRQPALGIYLEHDVNVTVAGLALRNLYVHSSVTDTTLSSKSQYAIEDYDGTSDTFTGNTFTNTQVGVYLRTDAGYGQNISIDHNDFGSTDNPLNQTYSFAGGSTGPVFFDNNTAHDFQNWDTATDAYHHDGVHCYTSVAGGGAAHSVGNYIYDNRFSAPSGDGGNFTSFIFIEGTGSGTPCDDATSDNWIFNNVFADNVAISNGAIYLAAGRNHVLNNTLIGPQTMAYTEFAVFNSAALGPVDVRNNILTTANQLVNSTSATQTASSPDFNLYANGGSNAFVCNGSFFAFGSFSRWQACIGGAGDSHSSAVTDASLAADGSPQPGSPALGAGTNLTPLCTGLLAALCQNINGTSRPASGAWNTGAF